MRVGGGGRGDACQTSVGGRNRNRGRKRRRRAGREGKEKENQVREGDSSPGLGRSALAGLALGGLGRASGEGAGAGGCKEEGEKRRDERGAVAPVRGSTAIGEGRERSRFLLSTRATRASGILQPCLVPGYSPLVPLRLHRRGEGDAAFPKIGGLGRNRDRERYPCLGCRSHQSGPLVRNFKQCPNHSKTGRHALDRRGPPAPANAVRHRPANHFAGCQPCRYLS